MSVGGVPEDAIRNIESVVGGTSDDTLRGDGNANSLKGGDGKDILCGGEGDDTQTGGYGHDTSTAAAAPIRPTSATRQSLRPGRAERGYRRGGYVGTHPEDLLRNIENLIGGSVDDALTGDAANNVLDGAGGNDVLEGGDGLDTLIGGTGTDTADYGDETDSVQVTLNGDTPAIVAIGGLAEDTVAGIENIARRLGQRHANRRRRKQPAFR